jgi:hypothetical protein
LRTATNQSVGVVDNLETNPVSARDIEGTLYRAASAGAIYPVTLVARLASSPASFGERLRQIAGEVHPSLRLHQVVPANDVNNQERVAMRLLAQVLGLMTLSVLLLSAAGIYALMAFTWIFRDLARQTRWMAAVISPTRDRSRFQQARRR